MAKKAKTHGGKREGSGRKEVTDKRMPVTIYPQESRIKQLGLDNLKRIALEAIEKVYSLLNK